MENNTFMLEAIAMAIENVQNGGGPFAAVVVKNSQIIGRGVNRVTALKDPTAHAEVQAIRDACKKLDTFQLEDCDIYTTCEPCPMCLGAIYWARPCRVFYGATRFDAAQVDFDDELIYKELDIQPAQRKIPMLMQNRTEALGIFQLWKQKLDKIEY